MKPIKAVIFDLEGTIIDTEDIWDDCAVEFLKRHGHVYNRETTKHLLMGGSIAGGAAIMRDLYGFEGDAETLGAERRAIFEELLQREVTFTPGFEDFYAKIRDTHKTAIATSMERRFIHDVDQRLHLNQLFDGHIYSIEDIGFIAKPNPDIFLHAAKAIGITKDVRSWPIRRWTMFRSAAFAAASLPLKHPCMLPRLPLILRRAHAA